MPLPASAAAPQGGRAVSARQRPFEKYLQTAENPDQRAESLRRSIAHDNTRVSSPPTTHSLCAEARSAGGGARRLIIDEAESITRAARCCAAGATARIVERGNEEVA